MRFYRWILRKGMQTPHMQMILQVLLNVCVQLTHLVLVDWTTVDANFIHDNEIEKVKICGGSSTNLVPPIIGRQLNEALHDILNFVHGPRVRDRMSHGEVQVDHVPKAIVYHIMYISLLLLSLRNLTSEPEIDNELNSSFKRTNGSATKTNVACNSYSLHHPNTERSIFTQILLPFSATEFSETTEVMIQLMKKCVVDYNCVYHPSAILHKNLMSCTVKLEKWTEWDRVCCNDLDYPAWETTDSVALPKNLSYTPLRCHVHSVIGLDGVNLFKTCIEEVPYEVLYRTKSELELVSVLSRIVCCVQSALDNTQDNLALKYSQYTNKTLRSRQRETYRRQLTSVPTVVLNCYFTCQLVYTLFMSLDVLQSDKSLPSNLLKSLKKVLKLHENIVSQTSMNMNRWDEALKNSIDNIGNIEKDFGK